MNLHLESALSTVHPPAKQRTMGYAFCNENQLLKNAEKAQEELKKARTQLAKQAQDREAEKLREQEVELELKRKMRTSYTEYPS